MSSSETEFDDDDDVNLNDYAYDDDYDDLRDFQDTARFQSLYKIILGTRASDLSVLDEQDIPGNFIAHLALNSSNNCSTSTEVSDLLVDDSLQKYLSATPLIRKALRADRYCLSLDPVVDDEGSRPLSTNELYVGNLPPNTRWTELKSWFEQLGYLASYGNTKKNKVNSNFFFIFYFDDRRFHNVFRETTPMLLFVLILLPLL